MSARRWKFYDLPVGGVEVAVNPPKRFVTTVHRYATQVGKKFRTRRVECGREVRRIA